MNQLENQLIEQLFQKRSVNQFEEKEVTDETLKQLYDLVKMGPTAFNAQPARFVFIKSLEAKERLKPFLMAGNVEKTMKSPITVIVATDYKFHDLLHKTFPVADVKGMFDNNIQLTETTAFRNSTLSAGYLIMAARALGLDVGAMSGFDNTALDNDFFPNSSIKSNFLINLGYGINEETYQRLPRLDFHEVSQIL